MQNIFTHPRLAAGRSARALSATVIFGSMLGAALAFTTVAAQETQNLVSIDNFTFSPKELTVSVGATVKWVNHDDIPHSIVDKKIAFRSKALDTDDSYSYTFASAGEFNYFCGLHPHMVGKIIVK
jgi:plastocyanin